MGEREGDVFTDDVGLSRHVTSVFGVTRHAAVTDVMTTQRCGVCLVSSGRFQCLFEGVADGLQ